MYVYYYPYAMINISNITTHVLHIIYYFSQTDVYFFIYPRNTRPFELLYYVIIWRDDGFYIILLCVSYI